MAEFTADLQSFRPLFPFLDIDSMELIHQFKTVNSLHVMDNSYFNHMQNLMPFSNSSNNIFGSPEESQFPGTLEENFSVPVSFPISSNDTLEDKKRKATTMDMNETTSVNSTPAVSENKCGKDKRVKRDVTTGKESKEVVHVRAKRGQATDSHSLAERVRRGKINEKFRSLQNIVPGCHKTMGMAIMLDEIINYVQSLQHQVEFLSMKLSAASTFYDFNSEIDAFETMQRERVSETRDYASQGYGGVSSFQPTWL